MITPVGQNNGVSFTSKQSALINATKDFKSSYFAKLEYLGEFNANTRALRYPGAKDDLSKYVPASEILEGLQQKVISKLSNPKAAEKLKVGLDQVCSTTFITIRKKGLLGALGLGKKTEATMLVPTADGKSELIPLSKDSLAAKIANAIAEHIKK